MVTLSKLIPSHKKQTKWREYSLTWGQVWFHVHLLELNLPPRTSPPSPLILLCAFKKDYTKWNKEKIRGVGTPRILIQSLNNPESCSVLDASSAGGLPRNIVLCRGMKVMLTANLCLSQGLANGSTGEVVAIVYITPEDPFPTVLVQFKDYTGQSCLPHLEQVYPVGIITRTWTARKKNQSRTMLPLLPGYALSIHKSQGQTLDKVLVDLGASEFSSGLTYTALTRVRSLASLAMRCMPPKNGLTLLPSQSASMK